MKKAEYRKLFKWIVLLMMLTMVIFSALIFTRLTNNHNESMNSQITRLAILNKLAASSIMEYFGKIHLSLKIADYWLSRHPDADPRIDKDFVKLIELLESDMADNVDIRLVSEKGGLYYIPSETIEPLADVSDREYFTIQGNDTTKGFYVGHPVKSRATLKWGIPMSYPLSKSNSDMSVIFAALEIPNIEKILSTFQMDEFSKTLIIRDDGIVLATAPFDETLIGSSIVDKIYWKQMMSQEEPLERILTTSEIDGTKRYVEYQKVAQTPIYVLSTSTFESINTSFSKTLLPGLLMILLLILVFSLVGMAIFNLLKKLDQALEDITEISLTDALSGLKNRRYFIEQLQLEIHREQRYQESFSLAIMDIDHFKNVNDTYGHDVGDQLIVEMGHLLTSNMRESDLVARWGGEEFIILMINADIQQAKNRIEDLRSKIQEVQYVQGIKVTASFGVTAYILDESYQSLVGRADQLMYQSKNNGRNLITVG